MYPTSNAEDGEKDINLSKYFVNVPKCKEYHINTMEFMRLSYSIIKILKLEIIQLIPLY